MKKSLKILYIINIIVIIISFTLNLISFSYEKILLGLSLFIISIFLLLLAFILFIICVIIGVINIKNQQSKKKNIIIMLIIMLVLIIISGSLPFVINNINDSIIKNKLENISKVLTKNIKNESKNTYVYLYDDLEKIYNNINDANIKENSYITNYENKIYVCISNGKQKLEGYENELKLLNINSFNEDCDYDFSYIYNTDNDTYKADGETYLKAYLEDKYNIKISDVVIDFECGLFSCNIEGYDVQTADISFRADAKVNNNKIRVTDNYYETINNLNDKDKIIYSIKNYTLNYLNIDDLTINSSIFDIYWLNDSQIIISTSYDKNDTYKFLQSLGEYLKNNNINCNIIINRKIMQNNSIAIDFAMNLIVNNNDFVINE